MDAQKDLKSLACVVTTVITTAKDGSPLVKTRKDGTTAPYNLIGIRFTEGTVKGKSTWAQRTLVNRDGVVKEPVAKGDEVFATLVNEIDGKPFFEVSTASNATDAELLSAFGIDATATATTPAVEEEIPLNA